MNEGIGISSVYTQWRNEPCEKSLIVFRSDAEWYDLILWLRKYMLMDTLTEKCASLQRTQKSSSFWFGEPFAREKGKVVKIEHLYTQSVSNSFSDFGR
jgi:hypothetical protein